VFSFHTVERRKPKAAGYHSDSLSVERKAAEERIAREAHRVVFLSETDFAATGRILPEVVGKGVVIPPGVDDSFRHPPPREEGRRALCIPPEAFLFLLAARPDPGKNVPAAVEAILALRGKGDKDAILLIAGQGPPTGVVPKGVIFTGPVPHARMPAFLSAADAALVPSEYESFGFVPMEAMAAGVPVIVPRESSWGETVQREGGGAAYPSVRPRGLVDAMADLMRDSAARSRMAKEGRRVAARFTWEKCTASWEKILTSAATRDNRR
jgi:glycosyltransferase involved in cell wall biosynthesis